MIITTKKEIENNKSAKWIELFFSPIIVSIVSECIFIPFINHILSTNMFKIQIQIVTQTKNINCNINLLSIVLALSFFVFLMIKQYIAYDNIVEKNRCINDELNSLKSENETIKQEKNTLSEEKALLYKENEKLLNPPLKILLNEFEKFTNENEVVDSVQLFSYKDLPDIEKTYDQDLVCLSIRYVGGYAKNNSNTLLFMQYYFESDIYRDLKKLFDLRKTYYAEKNAGKRANKKIFKEIKKSALDINLSLTKTLNDLSNINFIEEYHYTYYRILQILSNLIIPEKKAIECKRMLECPNRIENHLKTAQRNGILGSLFTGKMYCFYNEHIMKRDRMYFSFPITSISGGKYVVLVSVNKPLLRLDTNTDELDCCSILCENLLNNIKGVVSDENN